MPKIFDRAAAERAGMLPSQIDDYLSKNPGVTDSAKLQQAAQVVGTERAGIYAAGHALDVGRGLLPLAGGAIGALGGPVGVGLGAAAGEGLRQMTGELTGLDQPRTTGQAAAGVIGAGAGAAALAGTGTVVVKFGKPILQGLSQIAARRYFGGFWRNIRDVNTLFQKLRRAGIDAPRVKVPPGPKPGLTPRARQVRPSATSPKPQPKPKLTPKPGYTASGRKQYGASARELESRAKQLEAARERASGSLTGTLEESLALEQEMSKRGLKLAERKAIREAWRARR